MHKPFGGTHQQRRGCRVTCCNPIRSAKELRELVNSTADSTKTALAEFLVAIQDRTEARLKKTNPFCVNYWRRHLLAMASNLMAMASHLIAMSSNLLRMASNLLRMASNLLAMASN